MNAPILESGMKAFEYFDLVYKRLSVNVYKYNLRRNGQIVANYVQELPSITCLADSANKMYNALLLDYINNLATIGENKCMCLRGQRYYRFSVALHNTGVYYLYESCDNGDIHPHVLTYGLLPLMYVEHSDINLAADEYLEKALSPETAFSNDWRIV